jgi:hypothetical protein
VTPAAENDRRHHHGNHPEGVLAMKIETERANLTQSELGVLAEDRERWKRMGAGAHLDDWLAYGPGLMLRRRMAMHIAFVNRPEGKGYVQAFAALMEADGLHTMDKQSISAVLWLHDNPEHMTILREIRDTMTIGERSRLNSPISARQRVEKLLKVRTKAREEGTDEAQAEAEMKTSPMARMRAQNLEQQRRIAHLEELLAAAEHRDGSLFDLKDDNAEHIARSIAEAISEGKWKNIKKAVDERYSKAKSRPAG